MKMIVSTYDFIKCDRTHIISHNSALAFVYVTYIGNHQYATHIGDHQYATHMSNRFCK